MLGIEDDPMQLKCTVVLKYAYLVFTWCLVLLLFFSFLFVIEHMMPLCMVISWVYSVAMMIQHIVAEKEHRLKEVRLYDHHQSGVSDHS